MFQNFKCLNVVCRVQVFSGTLTLPFNVCPVCMNYGTVVFLEEDKSGDVERSKTD